MSAPAIHGRSAELSALDALLTGVDTDRLAVVRGVEGVGRTTLLGALDRRWRARGTRVLRVEYGDTAAWDEFGAGPVLAAVRDRFEEFGDGRVAAAVATVHRRHHPTTYRSRRDRSGLLFALAGLFAQITRRHRVALLADDVDAVPEPVVALAPALRSGCAVVAACPDNGDHPQVAKALAAAAGQVLNLGPLPADCLPGLLTDLTGTVPDEHLVSALLAALGSFGRHPATLLSTVSDLRRDRRLVAVRGRLCLADDRPIALPAAHRLVGHLGVTGRHLVALAATRARFGSGDLPVLAAATGRTVDDYDETVDRLVALGALARDDGRLTCRCPALAARVAADAGQANRVGSDPPRELLRQVTHGYRTGDWCAALSSARRLELAAPRNPAMLTAARLLAAEISAERGATEEAHGWLADADSGEPATMTRAWVDSGMRWRAGDHAGAFDAGWRAYRCAPAHRHPPGRDRLLTRLALVAVDGGLPERADRVLAEVENRCRRAPSRQTLLLVRAAVGRDQHAALAAAELARRRGHQPDLFAACLLAGELAEEPAAWLLEAHAVAERLGAAAPRTRLRPLLRAHGVAPGRPTRPVPLSETEFRIVELIRAGRTNRQIAAALWISAGTVERHLSLLFARVEVRSRSELALAAVTVSDPDTCDCPL